MVSGEIVEALGAGLPEALRDAYERGGAEGKVIAVPPSIGGHQYLVLPDGWHKVSLDEALDQRQPYPRRKKGTFTFTRHASFIDYVNQHATAGAAIFASEDGKFTAILNGHEPNVSVPLSEEDRADPDIPADAEAELHYGAPGWADHQAVFIPAHTLAWAKWRAFANTWWTQVQFAEFLEDRMAEIVAPDGATLYEITTNLTVNTNVAFRSSINRANGRVQMTYAETGDEGGGKVGDLLIPETITIRVAPFEGTEDQDMTGRFRFKAEREGKAYFHYSLGEEMDRVLRETVDQIAMVIHDETAVPVLYGAPS